MSKIRTYEADGITVAYEAARCIHAEACVTRLRAVFDNTRRPWIAPENAPADDIARTIEQCPTGALHYTRKDGATSERPDDEASIRVDKNGALYLRGHLVLKANGAEAAHARLALCRCGASKNKPFCDNAHKEAGFTAKETAPIQLGEHDGGGALVIEPLRDGPVMVTGNVTVYGTDGQVIRTGAKLFMCRCGHSDNKPFCDGTHRLKGFKAE